MPTVAMSTPMMPARMPLTGALPLSTATMVSPQSVSTKNSGEPKVSTSGRSTGRDATRTNAPTNPPSSDAAKEALRARAASPFLARG